MQFGGDKPASAHYIMLLNMKAFKHAIVRFYLHELDVSIAAIKAEDVGMILSLLENVELHQVIRMHDTINCSVQFVVILATEYRSESTTVQVIPSTKT